MANTRISDLTASASNLASTDLAPVVQTVGVGPVKMTGLQLAGGLLGSTTFNGSTVTTSSPVLNLTQTWNAGAVTFTGLKFNATDTASASGSLLLDLQIGASSKFSVTKSGYVKSNGIARENIDTASTVTGLIFQSGSGGWIGFYPNSGSASAVLTNGNIYSLGSGGTLAWASGADPNPASGNTYDLRLTRDAANTLALKNSTNPQIFRAYGTTTGPSYGYFASGVTDAGVATADTLFIGTGGAGAAMTKLALVVNGTTRADYNSTTSNVFNFNCPVHIPSAANNLYLGGQLTTGGSAVAPNIFVYSPASGQIRFAAAGVANMTAVYWGDNTSAAAPSLRFSGTTTQFRLADNSGDAALQCGTATSGGTAFNVNGTGGNSIASVTNTTTGTLLQVLNSTSNPLMTVTDTTSGTLFSVQSTTAATLFSVNDTTSGTLLAVTNSSSNDVFSVADGGAITGYDDTSANVVAIRNGTSLQTLRVYGTYTSSTNYERLFAGYVSAASAFRFGTEKGVGGGTARPLELQTDGTTRLTITTAGDLTIADAENFILGTTTGTKIGTATSQKIGFWNATPIVQPTTAVAEAAFVENSGGTAVNVDSTFGGYTLQQVVQALQNTGLLA